jgi:hypothetical protein
MLNAYVDAMNGGKRSARTNGTAPQQHTNSNAPSQGHKVSGGDLLRMMSQRTVTDS